MHFFFPQWFLLFGVSSRPPKFTAGAGAPLNSAQGTDFFAEGFLEQTSIHIMVLLFNPET